MGKKFTLHENKSDRDFIDIADEAYERLEKYNTTNPPTPKFEDKRWMLNTMKEVNELNEINKIKMLLPNELLKLNSILVGVASFTRVKMPDGTLSQKNIFVNRCSRFLPPRITKHNIPLWFYLVETSAHAEMNKETISAKELEKQLKIDIKTIEKWLSDPNFINAVESTVNELKRNIQRQERYLQRRREEEKPPSSAELKEVVSNALEKANA